MTPAARGLDLLATPIEDGITIVEASAGTGKTYCLTGLVLRLLLERRVEHVGEILVVTFTQAATEELIGRIRAALRDAHRALSGDAPATDPFVAGLVERHGSADGEGAEILRRALLDFDDLTVSTLHGFCRRVLEESAFESGLPFQTELIENDDGLLLEAGRDVWRRLIAEADPLLAAVAAARGWSPERFLADFRELRRHPRTTLLPAPDELPAAYAAIRAAEDRLRKAFDRSRLRLALQRLPWRAGSELADRRQLKALLETLDTALEASTADALADSLWAFERFHPEALAGALQGDQQAALAKAPGLAEVAAWFEALDGLEQAVRARFVDAVGQRFAEIKERGATLAFDDLLHRLAAALDDPRHGRRLAAEVRRHVSAALIDEFQDTDLVQYAIFRRLFGRGPLLLVGDPKQAIYRFRGADIYAYLGAKREAHRIYGLERNWRTGAPLLDAIHAVFSGARRPFVFADVPFQAVAAAPRTADRQLTGDGGAPLEWRWIEDTSQSRAEARLHAATAAEIAGLLASAARGEGPELIGDGGGRPLEPGDVAVLVRTNRQALELQAALREADVQAVVSRSGDIFHSDEMDELLRLLDAVLEPSASTTLRTACATTLWGLTASGIARLSDDDRAFQRLVDDFDAYRTDWQRHGFVAMIERLMLDRQVRRRFLAFDGGERRLTNLRHAVEVLHRGLHDRHLSSSGLISWARAERRATQHERDAAELRLESDARAVTITTVHKSKGLEYEVVFCPFLWQARAIDRVPVLAHVADDRVVYDCGSDDLDRHLALAESERLAEDLRLAYVALTRARRRVVVAWGPIGRGTASADSALAYLLHRRQGQLAAGDEGPIDEAAWVEAAIAEVRRQRERWRDDLEALVAAHPEQMALTDVPETPTLDALPPQSSETTPDLRAVEVASVAWDRLSPWRISSFSSLARSGGEREAPDHADPSVAAARSEPDDEPPHGLFAFARGPRAGDCLHRIFEAIDFQRLGHPEVTTAVRRELERSRLHEAQQHPAPLDPERAVLDMLDAVLGSPMPGERFSLAEIGRSARLVEWSFHTTLAPVVPSALAEVFRRHATAPWANDYADRLERLGSHQIEGFLTGFVDLVFEHDGRWFIVDWKSNHLGNHGDAYDRAAMTAAMVEHHYVLQYHLYLVALRRYLRERQPDFDGERDLGGVFYIFLRGVERRSAAAATPASRQLDLFDQPTPTASAPAAGGGEPRGLFVDRPPTALLDALDAWLGA